MAAMNWNMKKISAYRRSAGLAMAVVMSIHVLSGLGLFCANENLRQFMAPGIDSVAIGNVASDQDRGEVVGSPGDAAGSQGGSSKCCCKKHKKCQAIPRAAITSNSTHRFHEVQVQAKSVCFESVVPEATNHRFAARGAKPLMELAWCAPFSCSDPLALTSVLLI